MFSSFSAPGVLSDEWSGHFRRPAPPPQPSDAIDQQSTPACDAMIVYPRGVDRDGVGLPCPPGADVATTGHRRREVDGKARRRDRDGEAIRQRRSLVLSPIFRTAACLKTLQTMEMSTSCLTIKAAPFWN